MPPPRHESACLAAQAAHHHHRGQCQPRSAPASLSFPRHDLSLSLSLSRSPPLATVCDLAEGAGCLGRYACGPRFERWFRGNALASRFRIVWFGPNLGGEISTEISLKSRPTLAASKRVFFFVDHGATPGRPGAHPPASVRRCRRRRRRASEVALGERSRPPVRVRVDPTPSPSPRPTAFSSCLRVCLGAF